MKKTEKKSSLKKESRKEQIDKYLKAIGGPKRVHVFVANGMYTLYSNRMKGGQKGVNLKPWAAKMLAKRGVEVCVPIEAIAPVESRKS